MKPALVKNISNACLFQLGWWVCVLGGSLAAVAYTALLLAIHIAFIMHNKNELILILTVALTGVFVDSSLLVTGVLKGSGFFPPLWMCSLWLLFATTLLHSLHWLKSYPVLTVIFSAIAGPASYWAGVELTAIEFTVPVYQAMLILAALWAFLVPFFFYLSEEKHEIITL
jgi:hypothetical protein